MMHNNFVIPLFVGLVSIYFFGARCGNETTPKSKTKQAQDGSDQRNRSRSPQSRNCATRTGQRRTQSTGDDGIPNVITEAQQQQEARHSASQLLSGESRQAEEEIVHVALSPKLHTHKKSNSPVLASMGQRSSVEQVAAVAVLLQQAEGQCTERQVPAAILHNAEDQHQLRSENREEEKKSGDTAPSTPRQSAVLANGKVKTQIICCVLL